jgi:hypothetical protein
LFLLGCSTDSDDPAAAGPTAAEKAAGALKDVLGFASVSGTVVTLTGNVSPSEELEVPAGVTLVVPAGITLTAADTLTVNGTLSVAGTIDVDDTLTVSGTINNSGTIAVTGTYTLEAGVGGTNTGTVTIANGAVVINGAGVNITGTGTNVVDAGGTVYFDGDPDAFVGIDNTAALNLASGTFTYNNAGYVLDGAATINDISGDWHSDIWLSGAEVKFTINKGAVLTVGTNASIVMSSCTDVATRPLVGGSDGAGNDPTIVFGTNAYYYSYFSSSSTHLYFYDNSSVLIEDEDDNVHILPNSTTFTWNTSLAGGDGGWKAQ